MQTLPSLTPTEEARARLTDGHTSKKRFRWPHIRQILLGTSMCLAQNTGRKDMVSQCALGERTGHGAGDLHLMATLSMVCLITLGMTLKSSKASVCSSAKWHHNNMCITGCL